MAVKKKSVAAPKKPKGLTALDKVNYNGEMFEFQSEKLNNRGDLLVVILNRVRK